MRFELLAMPGAVEPRPATRSSRLHEAAMLEAQSQMGYIDGQGAAHVVRADAPQKPTLSRVVIIHARLPMLSKQTIPVPRVLEPMPVLCLHVVSELGEPSARPRRGRHVTLG